MYNVTGKVLKTEKIEGPESNEFPNWEEKVSRMQMCAAIMLNCVAI